MCEKAIEFLLRYVAEVLGITIACNDVVKNEILSEKNKKNGKENTDKTNEKLNYKSFFDLHLIVYSHILLLDLTTN